MYVSEYINALKNSFKMFASIFNNDIDKNRQYIDNTIIQTNIQAIIIDIITNLKIGIKKYKKH